MHTPGPWRWTDGENDIDIATYDSPGHFQNPQLKGSNGDDVIGCDEYWIIGPLFSEDKTMIANARLIAAAPDLLEVLERVHAHGYVVMADYDMVRDVIAKAKGE